MLFVKRPGVVGQSGSEGTSVAKDGEGVCVSAFIMGGSDFSLGVSFDLLFLDFLPRVGLRREIHLIVIMTLFLTSVLRASPKPPFTDFSPAINS